MSFKKGQIPWNKNKKGIHLSSKSEFQKGLIPWNKGTKGLMSIPWNKNKPIQTNTGRTHFKKGHHYNKGIKRSEEYKRKQSEIHKGKFSGEKHWNWKGGITPKYHRIRRSLEYKLWRKSIFERDNYTCIWCGQKGGNLEVDHIKPFAYFPELRFAIDNGRTLCRECHKKTFNQLKEWRTTKYEINK